MTNYERKAEELKDRLNKMMPSLAQAYGGVELVALFDPIDYTGDANPLFPRRKYRGSYHFYVTKKGTNLDIMDGTHEAIVDARYSDDEIIGEILTGLIVG